MFFVLFNSVSAMVFLTFNAPQCEVGLGAEMKV